MTLSTLQYMLTHIVPRLLLLYCNPDELGVSPVGGVPPPMHLSPHMPSKHTTEAGHR